MCFVVLGKLYNVYIQFTLSMYMAHHFFDVIFIIYFVYDYVYLDTFHIPTDHSISLQDDRIDLHHVRGNP